MREENAKLKQPVAYLTLDFLRPGRPTENGCIEAFNGKLLDESMTTCIDRTARWGSCHPVSI